MCIYAAFTVVIQIDIASVLEIGNDKNGTKKKEEEKASGKTVEAD